MNKYQYKVQGIDYDVEIISVEGNIAQVEVNGVKFEVEMKQPINPTTVASKPKVTLPKAQEALKPTTATPQPQKKVEAQNLGAGTKVTAPLPGTISDILVGLGDQVKAGDPVLILEAMKMQNRIEAETDGAITSILVSKGDTVMEGDTLLTIG